MSQKKLSLQEQLLKSGLVTTAQARTAKTEKNKQNQQQRHHKTPAVDEAKRLQQQIQSEKQERDKELNRLKQEQEEKKQRSAQIRQLIENHRVEIDENAIETFDDANAYHFSDHNKIKKLFVPIDIRNKIGNGKLAIVRLRSRYEIVPSDVAKKIAERDPAAVIVINEGPQQSREMTEDPYAQYQIPDDLIW